MALTEKYVTNAGAGAHTGADEANAYSWDEMLTAIAGGAAGTRFNVKGAISRTQNDNIAGSGTAASPVIIRGYSSTIGDLAAQGRINGTGALDTTGYPVITYSGGNYWLSAFDDTHIILDSLHIITPRTVNIGPESLIYKCKVVNNSSNSGATAIVLYSSRATALMCDAESITSTTSIGISCNGFQTRALYCHIIDAVTGIYINNYACTAIGNLIKGGTYGINNAYTTSHTQTIMHNTIVDCTTGIQLHPNANLAALMCCVGNHITGCTTAIYNGYNTTDQRAAILAFNRRRGNTNDVVGYTDWLAATDYGAVGPVAGADSVDYVNAASDDYRLISSAPGKASAAHKWDIGAYQRIDPTLPAEEDVESGVQYGDDGTEFTGTLVAGSGGAHPFFGDRTGGLR